MGEGERVKQAFDVAVSSKKINKTICNLENNWYTKCRHQQTSPVMPCCAPPSRNGLAGSPSRSISTFALPPPPSSGQQFVQHISLSTLQSVHQTSLTSDFCRCIWKTFHTTCISVTPVNAMPAECAPSPFTSARKCSRTLSWRVSFAPLTSLITSPEDFSLQKKINKCKLV